MGDERQSGLEGTLPLVGRSTSPTGDDALLGATLRHFRIDKLLGRGAMASVYLAWDTSLERAVALKVLASELAHDPEVVARFKREARTQAKLRHPNVTQIYFIGEDRGLHFFVMEHIDGATLHHVLETGATLPWGQAIEYVIMAARGLRAAHQQGFIHRDVKPSNLLVERDQSIKIADFGLVKNTAGDGELTQQGVIVGSPLYMAPEQGRAEKVDHRSDIYSLGCTLYHLITGKPPFTAASPVAIISMHVTDRATRIRAQRPEVPEAVERVVDRMMSKDPAARFSSYDELIDALEQARPGRRVYTGFWARGAALGVDAAMLAALVLALHVWALPLVPAYFIIAHRRFGQTVGKRLWRIQVTDHKGQRLTWKASALRFAAFAWAPVVWGGILVGLYLAHRQTQFTFQLSTLTARQWMQPVLWVALSALLLVGYLCGFVMAAFHPRHRALHDLAAHSEVSYAPAGGLKES